MQAHDYIPGVPIAGHIVRGTWHPGPLSTCTKCEQSARFLKHERQRRVQRTVPPKP